MKHLLLLALLLWGSAAQAATYYTFNGGGTSGDWNAPGTWTTDPTGSTSLNGQVPGTGDIAVVTNSFVLNVTANVTTTGLTVIIQRGGSLDLRAAAAFTNPLTRLAGQGTLRVGRAYFPDVTTNDFDDASTGTVEYYNWASTPGTLPRPGSGLYNNLRLLNTSGTAFVAQLDANLTVNGTLTLTRGLGSEAVALNMGQSNNGDRVLTVRGDVTVGAGATLGVTEVNGTHTLILDGSLTNNGVVKLWNSDAQRSLLRFTGTTDATLACNGPTDLSQLQVNKGTGSNATLSVTSTATLPVGGNLRLNFAGSASLLILTNGTAKLGANIVLPRLSNASGNYDIGTSSNSPTLWIAGATVRNNNANALVVYGTYRITAGRFESLGGSEGVVIREDGQLLIEGGTTVVEKFRPSNTSINHRGSFTITGGVFECSGTASDVTFARFAHPYKTQSFRMSGGIIRVQNPQNSSGLFHIGVNADNATVTGGTVELILPNSATQCKILSTAPLWNLTISKPAGGGTSTAQLDAVSVAPAFTAGATITAQPLTVLNNFTIGGAASSPATFDANSQDVNIAGTFTINAGCTYLPTTNTTRFSGGQTQLLTNNGSIGSTFNTFFNLTVDKSAGTLTLDGTATTFTVTNTLSLLNGVLNDGSKTVNVRGNIVNSASHTSGGGTGAIVLTGAGGQLLGGNGNGVFGNLTVNSTAAAGTVAATLTADQDVASVLTLQSSHVLNIGVHRLSLTSISPTALVAGPGGFSSQRMIRTAGNQSDLGLRKTYGGPDAFTFEVGTGSKYTPARVALTAAMSLYGKVSVSPTNVRNPFVTGTNALAYYWKVRSIDFGPIPAGSITASFTMLNSDVTGTLTNYVPGRYQPVAWTSSNNVGQVEENTPTAANSVIQFAGLNRAEGEFTAGQTDAFGPVTAYYSIRNGNWEDANPATTPWSTVSNSGAPASSVPGPANPVFIGLSSASLNHTVTVTASNARSGSLVIERGSTLDVQTLTGHNFGALPEATVGGSGRLRISAASANAEFPGGDFGAFLQAGGGTVEYYTTGGQSFTVPTTSVTSLALTSYKNLWVNAAAGQTVTLPNLDLRVYAQLRAGSSGGAGIVLLSGAAAGNLVVDSLLAVQTGQLRYAAAAATNNRTLAVGRDVVVRAGAVFDVNGTATVTTAPNALSVGGTFTNNGTVDFGGPAATTRRSTLTFTGSQNASLTGSTAGASTTLFALTLNKGLNQTPVLTVDVAGTLSTPTNSWLTLTAGTLRYARPASTLTIHDAASPYVINENAALTVDASGATVTVATANNAAADLQLAGTLRVLQGTLSVGTTANGAANDLEYASAGTPSIVVSGTGNLFVKGQVRRSTASTSGALRYDQSSGTVEIGGVGASATGNRERGLFEVQGAGSVFNQTGGTLTLRRSNQNAALIADLYLRPETTTVTGGTVVLGNAAAVGSVTVSVDSSVPLFDLRVESGTNGTNQNTGLLTGSNALTLKGSLTIGNSNAFFNANGRDLNIAQNLVNNNTSTSTSLTAGGFQPGVATQTTTFTGGIAAQQLQPAAGDANLTVFGNLVLANARTNGGLTLQTGRNARVAGTLTLTSGTLADNGQTITAVGDVVNSATHTSASGGSLTLGGATNQSVGGNGTGRFGNVTLNNAADATTTANQEITGVLTLSGGALNIGSNLLWLSNPTAGAVAGTFDATTCIRTNGIVADLGLRKSYPATALNFTFPLGVAGKYSPVALNLTANGTAGALTVRPINAPHPSTTDPANKELAYYWKLSSTGFGAATTLTHVYTYAESDVRGTEAGYRLGRFVNGAWTPQDGFAGSVVNPTANTLTLTGAQHFSGDYTGGEASEFGLVPTYYSRNATAGLPGGAVWNAASSWTFNPDGTDAPLALPGASPTQANPVVILSGHLINANGSSREAANLTLQGTGTLDLGANGANNFNTVSGTGTLRIGSSLFPAGNYADFTAPGTGGTVNYTAAVQLPARDTYNNLSFSATGAQPLSNLDLTINGALNVATGATVLNTTSQNLTLTSATRGATLNGSLDLNQGNLTSNAFVLNAATLTLGAGTVTTGTTFANTTTGTVNNGNGGVSVGTAFSNAGVYNANVGTGDLSVGTSFANSGAFNAGDGDLSVAGTFANATGGSFQGAAGDITVAALFTNAGTFATASPNVLTLNNDFVNTGGFAAGPGTMRLQGNFLNAGGTFTPGTSRVQLLADANRTVTGNPIFYNLDKLGNGTLTLTGTSDVTVSNLLTLSSGLIVTGTSNTLRLTNTLVQPIVGNSTTAYVSGRLAISLPNTAAASREFAVGLGGRYRPVTIQPQGPSANPVVLVEIFNGAPGGTVDGTLSNLSANRYYRIFLLSGSINQPTVQLSFNTEGIVDEQVNVPGNLRVARSTGNAGPWSNAGGAGVFSPAAPRGFTISAPVLLNINSFFALASTNAVDNPLSGVAPLPVQLSRFTATPAGTAVQLAWTTATEENSDYFEVQRSANGLRFEALTRVQAQGNSSSARSYAQRDATPLPGLSYYRLRLVDRDGTFAYSPVATVRFGTGGPASVTLYPNPSTGQSFRLATHNVPAGPSSVRIFDLNGRLVGAQTVDFAQPDLVISPSQPLALGMYVVLVQTSIGQFTQRLVVQE